MEPPPPLSPQARVALDALHLHHNAVLTPLAGSGTFIESADLTDPLTEGAGCTVCALGGLFYAMFRGKTGTPRLYTQLLQVFSSKELHEIEAAFEQRASGYGLLTSDVPEGTSPSTWNSWGRAGARWRTKVSPLTKAYPKGTTSEYRTFAHLQGTSGQVFDQIMANIVENGNFDPSDTRVRDINELLSKHPLPKETHAQDQAPTTDQTSSR